MYKKGGVSKSAHLFVCEVQPSRKSAELMATSITRSGTSEDLSPKEAYLDLAWGGEKSAHEPLFVFSSHLVRGSDRREVKGRERKRWGEKKKVM